MRVARSPPRPRSRPQPRAAASGSSGQPRAQFVQLLQRLERAQGFRVDRLELSAQGIRGHLDRQAELQLWRLERPLLFELAQHLASACDDSGGKARHRGDVDAIRAVRAARDDAMQKAHRVALLENLDALVAYSGQPLRKGGQLVIVSR